MCPLPGSEYVIPTAAQRPTPNRPPIVIGCLAGEEKLHHKKFQIPSHKLGGAVDRFGDHLCQFALAQVNTINLVTLNLTDLLPKLRSLLEKPCLPNNQ